MKPRLCCLELSAGVTVLRGEDAFWEIIRELDQAGPWTVRQVTERTNVSRPQVADFVKRLKLGGVAVAVAAKANAHVASAIIYRLAKRPLQCPRLGKDGSPRPESGRDLMWRAMKMLRRFTASELAEACQGVTASAVQSYCWSLAQVGVLAKAGSQFRLVNNLGAQAPKILRAQLVYDPNARAVVGRAVASEAKP